MSVLRMLTNMRKYNMRKYNMRKYNMRKDMLSQQRNWDMWIKNSRC